jgi:hypothetical protein
VRAALILSVITAFAVSLGCQDVPVRPTSRPTATAVAPTVQLSPAEMVTEPDEPNPPAAVADESCAKIR